MAIHWVSKVSYGVVAAALTAATGIVMGGVTGIVGWVSNAFVASTPVPFPPMSQTTHLQLLNVNNGISQLRGSYFEPDEMVEVFALTGPEMPTAQYAFWMNVQADKTGQFMQQLNLNVPANQVGVLYVSARGKHGYVAPVGPLRLESVTPTPIAPAAIAATAPIQLTVMPTQPPVVQPSPTLIPVIKDPTGQYYAEYFDDRDLTGVPLIARNERTIDSRWGLGAPEGLHTDNFSARYIGTFNFAKTENYEFSLMVVGGVRLWVDNLDGEPRWNDWRAGPRRKIVVDVPLTEGEHKVKIEYFASTGAAQLSVDWEVNYSRWEGRYYNTNNWTGPVIFKRDDGDDYGFLNTDWGEGAPVTGVNADNFSVMWERRTFFEAGEYKFSIDLDDIAKIYIDDIEVFNNLTNPAAAREFTRKLARGTHKLQVMYAEYGGGAKMKLSWAMLPPAPPAVP